MVRTRTSSVNTDPCCPICLEDPNYAVETNCGHMYCGDCILEVRRNEPSISPISCPFCRQDVTVLLACYTITEVDASTAEQEAVRDRITREIRDYNRMYYQHPRSIWGQLRDLPTILRHVWADFFTWRGLEFFYRMRIIICFVVAIIYAVVPFDFLPEAVLGLLGLLDDIFVIVFLLIQVGIFYRSHIGNS